EGGRRRRHDRLRAGGRRPQQAGEGARRSPDRHKRGAPRRRTPCAREGSDRGAPDRARHRQQERVPPHRPDDQRAHARDRLHQPHRKGAPRLMATATTTATIPGYKGAELGRSTVQASRSAFSGLLLRDLTVLRKNLKEFLPRTILQPFLLVFVFLYVFPTIGQGIGGGGGATGESRFATILVAGVVGLSIMFQGIQAVALPMVQEFGYTREIEDRVLAPLPVSFVSLEKITSGALQGLFAALIVFPIAAVVHASSIHIHLQVHW